MKQYLSVIAGCLALTAIGCSDSGSDEKTPDPKNEPRKINQSVAPGHIDVVSGTGHRATDPIDDDADGEPDGPIDVALANFDSPLDVVTGPDDRLFIIDWNGHKIRALDVERGEVAFVAGTGTEGDACEVKPGEAGCPALAAQLNHPADVTFDPQGRMVVAAWHNSKIKRLDFDSGTLVDVCGTGDRKFLGDGGTCRDDMNKDVVAFDLPSSVAYDSAGNLFIADQANQVIRRLDTSGVVKTVAGFCPGTMGFGCAMGQGFEGDGGPATAAKLHNSMGQGTDPQGKIGFDASGNLYIADTENDVIRMVTPGEDGIIGDGDAAEEVITTIAGIPGKSDYSGDDGPATEAALNHPTDFSIAEDGTMYIADRGNSCIRRIDTDGIITTIAGQCGKAGATGDGGLAVDARLHTPYGIALSGDYLFIADTLNHCLRKVNLKP